MCVLLLAYPPLSGWPISPVAVALRRGAPASFMGCPGAVAGRPRVASGRPSWPVLVLYVDLIRSRPVRIYEDSKDTTLFSCVCKRLFSLDELGEDIILVGIN